MKDYTPIPRDMDEDSNDDMVLTEDRICTEEEIDFFFTPDFRFVPEAYAREY